MTQAHINTILPIKNRVLAADENTVFLAHYDLNEHDVLRGVESVGESKVAVFDTTYFKPTGGQYSISSKLTMAAWVYPTAAPTGDRGAIVIGKPSGGYYMTLNTTYNLSVYWHGKTPAGYHDSIGTCPLNQWSHIAVVWSSTELKLYINGVLDKTIDATGGGTIPTAIDIGSENGTNRHFKGKISSLGIWAQEKSDEDIKNIMNKGASGNESGLRAFWKMNEGEGAILYDSSPFHQDITHEPNKTFSWSTGNSVFTLRPQEGYFGGGAIAVEEGTTNLATNGDFSNGLTDWNVYNNGVNGTVSSISFDGKKVLYLENVMYYDNSKYPAKSITLKASTFYTVSFDVYMLSGTLNFDPNGPWNAGYDITSTVGKWVRYERTFETDVTGGSEIFHLYSSSPTVSVSCYIANFQVEEKSFATSFVSGTRPTGKLTYPNSIYGSNEGTINFWAKFPNTRSILTSQVWFWDYDGTNVTEWFGIANSGGVYRLANFGDSDASLYQDTWHMYTIVKDATDTLRTYIDGVLVQTRTGSSVSNMFKSSTSISIGSHSNGAYPANILIDELRIDKVARTDEEIMAWYQSNSPFWPRGIYRKSY